MVMRWDPFRELDRLTEQMVAPAARQGPRSVPMDAYRHGDRFVIELDLPGVEPDSIDLTAERNVLTIAAERRSRVEEGDEVLVTERPQGTFSRQLFLGESLDAERIEADYDRGVLRLTIPVAERARPRRIEITSAGRPEAIEGQATAQ